MQKIDFQSPSIVKGRLAMDIIVVGAVSAFFLGGLDIHLM